MRLKDYLSLLNLTASEFAKKCGLPASIISRVLNRQNAPSLETIRKIHEASNGAVTAADFLAEPPIAKSSRDTVKTEAMQ